jgi:transposase
MQNSTEKIAELTCQINVKDQQILDHKSRITSLEEQLKWFKNQIFGIKSEKLIDVARENPLLPGLEAEDEIIVESDEDKKHVEYDRKGKNRRKGTCTLEHPDDIPVERIIKDKTHNLSQFWYMI